MLAPGGRFCDADIEEVPFDRVFVCVTRGRLCVGCKAQIYSISTHNGA